MATTPRCRRRFENAALAAAANLSVLAAGSLALAEDAEDAGGAQAYPACEVTPDERAMAAAKGAFEAGNAAFNEADYPRAITYWEDAYRRDCTAHPMLKNLARAYELDGQYQRAILALETYLERQPNSGDASSITLRIEALQKRLAEEPSRDAPVEASPVPPAAPPESEPPPPPPEPEMERSPVPLYVAGAGAVVGIVGGVLSYQAHATIEEIREECPDGDRRCARGGEGNEARDDAVLWSIVGGAGGAIAAGGLVWYFVQDERPAHGGLTLQLSPAHAGIGYSGSFDF